MRKPILLLIVLLCFSLIPFAKASPDVTVSWVWNKTQLYQGNETSFKIIVVNVLPVNVTVGKIAIHYSWTAPNAFIVISFNGVVSSGIPLEIPVSVNVPVDAKLGRTSDFACIIAYDLLGGWIDTDVIRAPEVNINVGKSVYVPQPVLSDSIMGVCIIFLSIVGIAYGKRSSISELLRVRRDIIPILIFLIVFIINALFISLNFTPYLAPNKVLQGFSLFGDEPHYILAAKAVFSGSLSPQSIYSVPFNWHIVNSTGILNKGQLIFSHPLGLSIISAIPYYLGQIFLNSGVYGCLLFMDTIISMISVLIYKSSMILTKGNGSASVLTTVAFAFSSLLFIYSGLFFTEPVLTFFIMVAIYLLLHPYPTKLTWVLTGISLGILPFFKYQAIFLSIISLFVLIILLRRERDSKYLFISLAATITLFLTYMVLFVGLNSVPMLGAYPYDAGVRTYQIFGYNIDKLFYLSIFGLFLDQNCGIIFYSPILILSALGFFQLVRTKKPAVYLSIILFIFWTLSISASTNWNGWLGSPGKYMVVVLPLLSLPFCLGVQSFVSNKKYLLSYLVLFLVGLISNTVIASNRLLGIVMTSLNGISLNWYMRGLDTLFGELHKVLPEFFDTMWYGSWDTMMYWIAVLILAVIALLNYSYSTKKDAPI